MENERGRKTSQGAQQISPAPSPHQYDDATAGMDPSATFSTDSFGTDQQSYTFAQTQDTQPFMTDFTLSQMSNPYLNNMDPSFNPAFVVPSNNFADAYPSQFATNQFETDRNNVNPADLSKISSPENHSPRLLSPDNLLHSGPQSPASTSGQFQTPQHSRNTSLDPSSAYHTADWTYRHQRSPSDVSDRSSVNNSPYNQHVDIDGHPSPLMAGQDTNTFGLDSININESHSQPGSAYHSPRLIPVQDGLGIDQNAILASQYSTGQELFPDDMYQMHNRHESVASDIGQADQFVPPTINIEPAPVSRQASFGPNGEILTDTLSPTSNSGRGRIRAQSDVTFTRPMGSRSVSPGRSNRESLSVRSPSPGGGSRSSSPGVSDGRISKDRRASTSAINNNNREYILDLADPNRPNGGQSGGSTRVQKHPATFQCNLCPKRFTRAYNLRSHLRTHTDERPFVCTVCSKAFARQHDRKRHEGLHSGEKKFVCKGELNSNPGQAWGCGRRFARADALGRHFRSEAGRVCIKPLLEEEAAERRQKAMMEAQQQAMLQPVPQPIMTDPTMGFTLPAALMTQYPQLATINWAALQSQADDDPGELSDIGIGGGYDDGLDAGGISDSGTYGHTSVWG